MTIEGLLFDKDGTLFDFTRTWSVWCSGLIAGLAKSDAEAARLARTLKFDRSAMRFAPDSPVIGNTWAELAPIAAGALPGVTEARVHQLMHDTAEGIDQVPAVPLHPLLSRLASAGLRLGLSTNDGERPARIHLQNAGILDLFDFVAGYDSGHGAKPGPGMQEAFCKAMGLEPQAVAMVGDSLHDLLAGRAAGMVTVGVLTGPATREEIGPLADVVLADIGEIPAWLGLQE